MGTDYLTLESEEVRTLFGYLDQTDEGLRTAEENYQPAIQTERYLTGEELCDYLHISVRTLQTLRDTRKIPFTVVGERTILYPEASVREILNRNFRPVEDPF